MGRPGSSFQTYLQLGNFVVPFHFCLPSPPASSLLGERGARVFFVARLHRPSEDVCLLSSHHSFDFRRLPTTPS